MNERHNAILEDRQRLMLTGVTDVDSFDEKLVELFTQLGELTIRGKNLHVNEMSLASLQSRAIYRRLSTAKRTEQKSWALSASCFGKGEFK